MRKGIHKAGSI